VAADHHRVGLGVGAVPAGEDVADPVGADPQAGLARPLHELVAAAAVFLGQGDAAHPAFGRGADSRQRHQRVPKSCTVDADRFHFGAVERRKPPKRRCLMLACRLRQA
jgi:hypothetical protein